MAGLVRRLQDDGACTCVGTAVAREPTAGHDAKATFYGHRFRLNRSTFKETAVVDPRPCT